MTKAEQDEAKAAAAAKDAAQKAAKAEADLEVGDTAERKDEALDEMTATPVIHNGRLVRAGRKGYAPGVPPALDAEQAGLSTGSFAGGKGGE